MNPAQRLAQVAARQEATFTDEQACAAGFSDWMRRKHVHDGVWRREHPGVLSLAGSPQTWEQSLSAAWLAAGDGAVVSLCAAGKVHGLIGRRPRPEITLR